MILSKYHEPVLLKTVIEFLQIKKDSYYLDATIGGGGYAKEIIGLGGKVLGIDEDRDAVTYLKANFKSYIDQGKLNIIRDNFSNLDRVITGYGLKNVSGIIFDLGISSHQLERSKRGFTYRNNEPLDMRFNDNALKSAADIINRYSRGELYEIFTKNSEELNSRAIADAVFRARTLKGKINTTFELNEIIKSVMPGQNDPDFQRIITRIYQALRIETNSELINLKIALEIAPDFLETGGRIIVLSYHSLEDRQVKNIFRQKSLAGKIKTITKKPIYADNCETEINRRAKSAKLRAAEKLL